MMKRTGGGNASKMTVLFAVLVFAGGIFVSSIGFDKGLVEKTAALSEIFSASQSGDFIADKTSPQEPEPAEEDAGKPLAKEDEGRPAIRDGSSGDGDTSGGQIPAQPNEDGTVIEESYSSGNPAKDIACGKGWIKNVTKLSNDEVLAYAAQEPEYDIIKNGPPQVLIYHTHTTECFLTEDTGKFDTAYTGRTDNPALNMIRIGEEIVRQLEATGIGVVHDTEIHDYEYYGSYSRSRKSVLAYLEKYPSIEIALDIHRDAIINDKSTITKPTVEINGRKAAQIMIISGCDNGSMNMRNWPYNLRLAARLQDRLEQLYPGITRPVLFDYRGYNQDLTNGSLLIEVGAHANTIHEATYSGELFGRALAGYLDEIARR
jgi:stage II sporulation protein P